jgi:hypothetical protein
VLLLYYRNVNGGQHASSGEWPVTLAEKPRPWRVSGRILVLKKDRKWKRQDLQAGYCRPFQGQLPLFLPQW